MFHKLGKLSWSAPVVRRCFYALLISLYALHLLFKTAFGLLVVAALVYIFVGYYTEVTPMSAGELAIWLSDQSDESKAALLASVVTSIGFYVTFLSARQATKDQLLQKAYFDAYSSLDALFTEATTHITTVETWAKFLVKTKSTITQGGDPAEIEWRLGYIKAQEKVFADARQSLNESVIKLHNFDSRYGLLLIRKPLAAEQVKNAVEMLDELSTSSWFRYPYFSDDYVPTIEAFLLQEKEDAWRAFIDKKNEIFTFMHGQAGGAKGLLIQDIAPFGWSMLVKLLRSKAEFNEHYQHARQFHARKKKSHVPSQ